MNVVVTLEHRFATTPDGKVWTQTAFPYTFWKRYLAVFDSVRIVARSRKVKSVPSDWKRVDGTMVSFVSIPYYIGPWEYLKKSQQVKQTVRNAVGKKDAVILRVDSQIACCLEPILIKNSHPYAVEVVADPYDVFAPGSVEHPLRPFFRWWCTKQLKRQCANASAASYVTKEALQQRYPCSNYATGISDVDLPSGTIVNTPRPPIEEKRTIKLIFVGTLAQLYKAPNVLIDSIAICCQSGLNISLTIVGDGQYRSNLQAQVKNLGLKDRINFQGQLASGDAVRSQLDIADLFILPSYQEGLPRAMVEAMGRGLPCIGSTVGGIPELLSPFDMVPPGDAIALAKKIQEVVSDPDRMVKMSADNLEKARKYTDEVLSKERIEFFSHIKEITKNYAFS
ncbi:MAG: glycosyltransferase [Cyanobacteria bacterium P01_A01_bin.84]